jgi:hypothetical protein
MDGKASSTDLTAYSRHLMELAQVQIRTPPVVR